MSESFGGLPPAPPPSQGWGATPPQRGARPSTVTNAVRLMIAQVALSLISVIVLFATKDDLKDKILDDNPNASDSTVDAALTVGAVIGIVILVFYALLTVQVNKGRNWARIVTWVLAGLGILSGLLSFGQPEPALTRILGVVGLILDIAIVVLLALAPSNRYFRPGP